MLARAFSADRSALVARWLLKIAYKMACRTTCKIFSAARAERMAPSGADGFYEGEARVKRQLARRKSAPGRARSGSLSAVA